MVRCGPSHNKVCIAAATSRRRIDLGHAALNGRRGFVAKRCAMTKRVLVLTASAVLLACSTIAASAQENSPGGPMIQDQSQVSPQRQELERLLQRLQARRGGMRSEERRVGKEGRDRWRMGE